MERSFKGVWIPKEIWLSKELTLQEKVFLVEIESLDNEDGCFASNNYFAEFFGLSKNRCSEVIKSLEKKKLISIDYIRQEGKKNIQKRVIKVFEKSNGGIRNIEEGYSENLEENNTSINNTLLNSIYTIFEFWNSQKIVVHRKPNDKIKSRIKNMINKHGYSENDLKEAITNYKTILNGDEYFWSYKWGLLEFLKPENVDKFLTENNPFENYLKAKGNNQNGNRKVARNF